MVDPELSETPFMIYKELINVIAGLNKNKYPTYKKMLINNIHKMKKYVNTCEITTVEISLPQSEISIEDCFKFFISIDRLNELVGIITYGSDGYRSAVKIKDNWSITWNGFYSKVKDWDCVVKWMIKDLHYPSVIFCQQIPPFANELKLNTIIANSIEVFLKSQNKIGNNLGHVKINKSSLKKPPLNLAKLAVQKDHNSDSEDLVAEEEYKIRAPIV